MGKIAPVGFLFLLLAATVYAQGLPVAKSPEEVGLSSERLKRISASFQSDIDKGAIPGAVVLVARKGKVAFFEALGFQNREEKIPMTRDSIFPIASMTKPFTSLAIMMLVEEGKIQLPYPASRYLPEFKELKVGIEKKNETTGNMELTVASMTREMTVLDLLRHTSGLTYAFDDKSLIKKRYLEIKTMDPEQTNAELVTKLSQIPLVYQPGTTWDYSQATDVLGRIVEILSGLSLDAFFAERITNPLKLPDTAFWFEGEKVSRVAYAQVDPGTGKRPPAFNDLTKRPKWMGGGGGLGSTASDYARFCQMLLNGGVLDGVRLVSRKTVELMTADHLPAGIPFSPFSYLAFAGIIPSPEAGQGFGLGFAVRTQVGRNGLPGSVGDYFWAGAYGTYFWIDPREELVAILMMQAPPQRMHYRYLMRELVYQAIVD
jgi:CubicO group peptidase (beta-lactamase class C family)